MFHSIGIDAPESGISMVVKRVLFSLNAGRFYPPGLTGSGYRILLMSSAPSFEAQE